MELLARQDFWRRLAFSALCLVIWRALEQVSVAGIAPNVIRVQLFGGVYGPPGLLNLIAGSTPLAAYSVVLMGIAPYINALIIVNLAAICSNAVRTIQKTSEGRLRVRRWTRALALLLALGQAYGFTVGMQSANLLPTPLGWFPRLAIILEVTAGTVILMFLADALDDFGLGFGYGAILIYALGPVATELHRLAAFLSVEPSFEAVRLPLFVWTSCSVGIIACTVAVLLAASRLEIPSKRKNRPPHSIRLNLLMSGVLRPPFYAGALMEFPGLIANYLSVSNPAVAGGIRSLWTPYGTSPWVSSAYVATNFCLIVIFAGFAGWADFMGTEILPVVKHHILRLSLIGGVFVAFAVAVMPVVERAVSLSAGLQIPMSGHDAVLIAAVVVGITAGHTPHTERARAELSLGPTIV